jgi:hypothetical protein
MKKVLDSAKFPLIRRSLRLTLIHQRKDREYKDGEKKCLIPSYSYTSDDAKISTSSLSSVMQSTSFFSNLSHSILSHSILSHSILSHSILSHSILSHSILSHSILSHSSLSHSSLSRPSYRSFSSITGKDEKSFTDDDEKFEESSDRIFWYALGVSAFALGVAKLHDFNVYKEINKLYSKI